MFSRSFLAPVVLLAALGLAQESSREGQFVSEVELRVVNVEVMVTDSDGLPVTDLAPTDFEVFEDGEPQAITNFYRIVRGAAQLDEMQQAGGLSREDERFQRRVLLVIDNNFLDSGTRARALAEISEFVGERFDGDAHWAVAAVGEKLDYLLPFTRDPFEVSTALNAVGGLPTYSSRHSLDRSLMNDPVRAHFMQSDDLGGAPLDIGAEYRFVSREQAMRNLRSFAVMARVLGGLMRSYAGFGGRKAIVLVTGKMEFHPEMSYLVSRDPRTRTDSGLTDRVQSDPALDGAKRELEAVLDGLVRASNSAGFQLYTLAAQGLTNPARLSDVSNRSLGMVRDAGSFASPPELSDTDTAPLTLSQGTGGLSLRSNDLEAGLGRVVDDTATYYSLGYEPSHGPDHEYHTISVRVKRNGLKVRHRAGYLDLTESERIAEELATPLEFPKPKGELPVELAVEEQGAEGGKVKLHVRVDLPISSLTLLPAPEGGLRGEVEVFLAVYDEKGQNVTVIPQRFPLYVPAGQEEAARAGNFRPTLAFSLDPGAYTVSVTVRDPVVRERGTVLRQVYVGERKGQELPDSG